jgi:peroxiredoxin Q/BCP
MTPVMLSPGDRAPAFKLQGDDGKTHSLAEFAGKTLVLYFYPKDNTPGCTVEACEFRDEAPAYKKRKAVVVGVSPDSIASHGKFRDKHALNFLLLSDPDHGVAEKYGAWGDKVLYGRKFKGLIRSTFVIDGKGAIVAAHYKVSAKGHAADVLEAL